MDADDLISHIETLPVGDGDLLGEPYRVLKYQRAFLRGAFRPGIIRAGFTLARGGGKTGLASAIALSALLPDSPLHRDGFECAIVASSFQQGTIAGNSVKTSLRLMGKEFGRVGHYRVRDSQNMFEIINNETESRLKVYGSDSKRAHGLRPNLLLCDEPAQWEIGGEKLAAALRTALGKRKGARMLAFGTRPDNESHWFERMLTEKDPSVFQMVFQADRKKDPFDEIAWRDANPALDEGFPDIEILRAEARLARNDPDEMASFRALRLNQGTSDIHKAFLIDPETWKGAEVIELPEAQGKYALGIDLGGVGAFTAASAYWWETGRLDGFQACGGNPALPERAKTDRVPGVYEKMEQRGELLVLGGKVVPIDEFLKECVLRWGPPAAIACDRWREGELVDAVNATKLRLPYPTWRGQGFRDGNEDIRAFKTELLEGRVSAPESLAMRAAFAEARVMQDPAGNEKLAKKSEAGRRQRGRDDLANAIILAVAEGSRRRPKSKPRTLRYVKV